MDEYATYEARCAPRPGRRRPTTRRSSATGNIYYGPALMWHELRKKIGDEAFWQVVRDWPAHDPDTNAGRDQYLDLAGRAHRRRPVLLRGLAAEPDHP